MKKDSKEIFSNLTLEIVIEFCKHHMKQLIGAGIVVVFLIILAIAGHHGSNKETMQSDFSTQEELMEYKNEQVNEEYDTEKEYADVETLITKYYAAYAENDLETLQTIATPITTKEKSYIKLYSEYSEEYSDIQCHVKEGYDDYSYFVSVEYSIKFANIDTLVPGLDFFYIQTNDDGELYIDNAYSSFNRSVQETQQDENVSELIDSFENSDDVVLLQKDVSEKYEEALESDEALKTLMEETIPNAVSDWYKNYDAEAAEKEFAEDTTTEESTTEETTDETQTEETTDAESTEETTEESTEESTEETSEDSSQEEEVTYVYAKTEVNVRKKASIDSKSLGLLKQGKKVQLIEKMDNGWSKVKYKNKTGYIKSKYLTKKKPSAESTAFSKGDKIRLTMSVNIRKKASENSKRIGLAYSGEKVTVVKCLDSGWTKVKWNGKTGYIKTSVLKEQ
ncbi:SH3 domain-containing protein [Eubacterium oxidoreducens]|uniref:SH3 domain-containing protein n=1 Tax=Eubacterium oxidoreducens TaxID=1732 RepID=A0A1G6AJX8_EUBOX|nr:SH3 domain-containing protein [Eubacterium oxidoreducens]SDB08610.1 SH3 domain-containing protein [Eubacterium oxidoreducens]